MTGHIIFREEKIHFSDHGKGRVVVFLHGFLESIEMWQYYIRKLQGYRRIICVDLPGHGRSGNFGYVHSMEMMADAVHAVLRHLMIRKCIIVGHSMGGYVGLAFAERYPDFVHGLVLYYSTARADSRTKKKDRDRAIELVKRDYRSFIRTTIPMLFAEKNRDKYQRQIKVLIKRALQMKPQGVIGALEGMKRRKDREVLLQFSPAKFLFVAGEADPVIPVESVRQQVESSGRAQLQIIEGCGHMGFIECKKQSLAAVRRFVNRIYRLPVGRE